LGDEHSLSVNEWMERVAIGQPPQRLVHAFEQAFGMLWRRAHRTLGGVTLGAIVERVLHNASERFPVLQSLELGDNGLECRRLLESVGDVSQAELEQGIRFVLVEFLTVLGNLTAEILTPALHAELSKTTQIGGAKS
jgi:hypothetical protein